jgi:hypothetical protein
MIAGCASAMAKTAAGRSPAEIASSTLRTAVRRRERLALLIAVRRAIWRAAFLADLVLAMTYRVLEPVRRNASWVGASGIPSDWATLVPWAALIGVLAKADNAGTTANISIAAAKLGLLHGCAVSGHLLGADRIVARDGCGAVGGGECREWRRHACPLRLAVNVREEGLHAGNKLLAVE